MAARPRYWRSTVYQATFVLFRQSRRRTGSSAPAGDSRRRSLMHAAWPGAECGATESSKSLPCPPQADRSATAKPKQSKRNPRPKTGVAFDGRAGPLTPWFDAPVHEKFSRPVRTRRASQASSAASTWSRAQKPSQKLSARRGSIRGHPAGSIGDARCCPSRPRASHRPPRVPRDLEDDERDREPDRRIGNRRPGGNGNGARDDAE